MRINLDKAYVPQAGDILAWISGEKRILFVVLQNSILGTMTGVTLYDNRKISEACHIINITDEKFNYRLHLICKADKIDFSLDQILEDWRAEND